MKNIRFLIIMAAFAILPGGVSAQLNLMKAIDDFVNGPLKKDIKPSITEHRDPNTYQLRDYYYAYTFTIKKSDEGLLRQVCDAFHKDTGCAYLTFEKPSSENSSRRLRIKYGDNNQSYYIIYGEYSTHNYLAMLVNDPSNKARRYAFGISWYTVGKKISGRIFKILSLKSNMDGDYKPISTTRNDSDSRFFGRLVKDNYGREVLISNNGRKTTVESDKDTFVINNSERMLIINDKDTAYVSNDDGKTSFFYGGRRYDLNKKGGEISIDKKSNLYLQGDDVRVFNNSRTSPIASSGMDKRFADAQKNWEKAQENFEKAKIKANESGEPAWDLKLNGLPDNSKDTADKIFSDKMAKQSKLFNQYAATISEISQKEIWTDIANKTVALCKEYKDKIGEDAKTENKYRLMDMRGTAKENNQATVATILTTAINYLK